MVSSVVLAYFGLAILSAVPQNFDTNAMATSSVSWIIFAFFMLSVAIALLSVIAGIGGFVGAHSYLANITCPDAVAQLVVNIGCAVGLFAIVPTVIIQLFKEKEKFYSLMGSVFGALVVLAMVGII